LALGDYRSGRSDIDLMAVVGMRPVDTARAAYLVSSALRRRPGGCTSGLRANPRHGIVGSVGVLPARWIAAPVQVIEDRIKKIKICALIS
jgi:hypothetical protein